MTTLELIQFMLLFCMSIVFTAFAIDRETVMTFLFAGVAWIATGLLNFMFDPTGSLPMALSYLCIALGIVCFLGSLKAIGDTVTENRQQRWKVGL